MATTNNLDIQNLNKFKKLVGAEIMQSASSGTYNVDADVLSNIERYIEAWELKVDFFAASPGIYLPKWHPTAMEVEVLPAAQLKSPHLNYLYNLIAASDHENIHSQSSHKADGLEPDDLSNERRVIQKAKDWVQLVKDSAPQFFPEMPGSQA